MLAFNVSNLDRPNANQTMAIIALDVAKDTLNSFGASDVLSSRIWTAFGEPQIGCAA